MKYMLDTNICIYAIKNKPECVFRRVLDNIQKGLCISVITFAELTYGIAKSDFPEKNRKSLSKLLAYVNILSFDEAAAEEYGEICASLKKKGTSIGVMDMLIAAHAKTRDCVLVTNNVKEFERVNGLVIENWTEEQRDNLIDIGERE